MRWWVFVVGFAAFEISSFVAWLIPSAELSVIVVWSIAAVYIAWRSLSAGFGMLAADLLIDPMGRMIAYDSISFRMVLFAVIIGVWLIGVARGGIRMRLSALWDARWRAILCAMLIFFAVYAAGVVHGLVNGFPVSRVVDDGNGLLFFALAPLALSGADGLPWRWAAAGFAWLTLKSAMLFAWFSHAARPYFDSGAYRFFRDTRVAEITPLAEQGVRMFMQSHVYAALVAVVLISGRTWALRWMSQRHYEAALIASLFLTFMSLSRSMWLGVGVVALWYVWRRDVAPHVLRAGVVSIVILGVLFALPIGNRGSVDGFFDMFVGRGAVASEYAAVSRWVMLPQLNTLIVQRPLFGYGFGFSAEIADVRGETAPRTAFEWGWHDLVLKVGVVGLVAFLWMLISVARFVSTRPLVASLIALVVIHVFTPYLNHPLGIGWVVALLLLRVHGERKGSGE